MTDKGLSEDRYIVSAKEISLILGLSSSRIRQLQSEKALVRVSHGKYDLPASIQSYIEYVLNRDTSDEKLNKTEEEALWTKARREKAEIELAIMKGEVHRSEDVETVMNDMLASFRAQLLVLPGKVAPHLLLQSHVEVIKSIIKDYLFEAMQELADYDPNLFYDPEQSKWVEKDELEKEIENLK